MPVLYVVFVLVVIGICMWFVNNRIPFLTPGWKLLINLVVGVAVAYWLVVDVFGIGFDSFGTVPRAGGRRLR
jgi:hypothetical protein